MVLTAEQLDQLKAIQQRTQRRFTYVPDPVKWKTPDYWIGRQDGDLLAGKWEGDCDDFALICRAECRKLAIANRLVLCWVPSQAGYHLVTEVEGWLFDCRFPHLMERDLTEYVWIELSGYQPGDPWHWAKGFDPAGPWPHQK